MNDFTFEAAPWELTLEELEDGTAIDAVRLLTVLEGAGEEEAEDVMMELDTRRITLDITQLPKPGAVGQAAVRLRREADLVQRDTLLEDLEENDPLRLYLEEVAATPVCGDENLLADSVAAGDQRAMEQLTHLGLSRVIALAKG